MNTIKQKALLLSQNLKTLYTASHAITVAWWLLEKLTQKNKALLLVSSDSLSEKQETQLKEWEDLLLIKKYPLQYILETIPFGPLELFVKEPTLIPRPETEQWCSDLIELLKKGIESSCSTKNDGITILDMCTGSGCIGLWIAKELPCVTVHAVDISKEAIALSQKNALHNAIKNIKIIESDLFKNIPKKTQYDIIISNPPYVTEDEWKTLDPQVKNWEDKKALVADENGLKIYKEIVKEAHIYLKKKTAFNETVPRIVFEIGHTQADVLQSLLDNEGYKKIKVVKDSAGKNRIIYIFK